MYCLALALSIVSHFLVRPHHPLRKPAGICARRRVASPWTMRGVSVDHYENFPVASLLCPPALRPAVAAIYWFARTADDIADEGHATAEQRLEDLVAYRAELRALAGGQPASARWPDVFTPLGPVIARWQLPMRLFEDLLSAFEQDITQHRYRDRPTLLDYCRRSANPVGRLLLHLYGLRDAASLRQSDAICTALQLINFWQDLQTDTRRGRLYVPLTDCTRHQVNPKQLLDGEDSPAVRVLVGDAVAWARELMRQGAPLVHSLPGRAGWELRLVVQGGLRILNKLEARDFDSLHRRPRLRAWDVPLLLWRAARMRPDRHALAATPS